MTDQPLAQRGKDNKTQINQDTALPTRQKVNYSVTCILALSVCFDLILRRCCLTGCSDRGYFTHLSMECFLLINVQIVSIPIFIYRINTTAESLTARNVIIFHHLSLVVNSAR